MTKSFNTQIKLTSGNKNISNKILKLGEKIYEGKIYQI